MTSPITVECNIHFRRGGHGCKRICQGEVPAQPLSPGRVPRLARLMALAIRFDGLIRAGDVTDYAELAMLGHVSRARITQVMNLLMLAPDIQEQILFLPVVERGHDPTPLRQLQPIAAAIDWKKQRRMWKTLSSK